MKPPTKIELVILDVDGVLTGGGIAFTADGEDAKVFNVQDGCAIKLWQRSGGAVAILSGRHSQTIPARARELGVELIEMGCAVKVEGYERITRASRVDDPAVCVVGDDLPDMAPMRRAGYSVAVHNALPAVKRVADYVTRRPGGAGVVAEIVEHLLRRQSAWTAQLTDSA